MKNKKILVGICIVLAAIAFVSIYHLTKGQNESNVTTAPEDASHIAVEAKIDEYHSLKEIEDKADVIVRVTKESEESPIIQRDEMGNVNFVGTIGNVEVTQLYTNKSAQNIEVGDTLPIFENEAYDSGTNTVYHVANYTKMEIGKEYMLFLTYSESDHWYVPCSAVWGKYPLNDTEAVLFSADDSNVTQNSARENIMEQIGQEVLDKYN